MLYNVFMGLIKTIKRWFKKDISIDFDISSFLVFVYKLKNQCIKLQTKITIPENFDFIIGKNGKVLDLLSSGENVLSLTNLPVSVKKFKLDKVDKYGKLPNKFEANAYFLNLKVFEYVKWNGYRKARVFDKDYGPIRFSLSGAYAFKISNSSVFMSNLLKIYDYLKNKEAEKILEGFISELVIYEIEKQNYGLEILKNKDALTDLLFEPVCQKMNTYGVEVLGFIIEKITIKHKNLNKRCSRNNNLEKKEVDVTVNRKKLDSTQKKEYHKTVFESLEENCQTCFAKTDCEDEKVRCLLCGYENNAKDENCVVCGEKLKRRLYR